MARDDLTADLFQMPPEEAPLDNCPGCMTKTAAERTGRVPGGTQASYRCGFCSWTWDTAWWEGGN